MEKCRRRARESVFWPGLTNQIEQKVGKCETCIRYLPSKPKEPMLPHEVPTKPWEKVAIDLFHYPNRDYIIIVDYYSLWPEVYLLKTANSANVIEACKDSFSRHGIPTQLFSDNGSQYSSRLFKSFAKKWQFQHKTSSPHYPQSNGLAEITVKAVKNLLKKSQDSKEEFQQGLLILRNTPLACGKSPAQLMFGRSLRDNLPIIYTYQPTKQNPDIRNIPKERLQSKEQYDKTARHSSIKFHPGQAVAVQTKIPRNGLFGGKYCHMNIHDHLTYVWTTVMFFAEINGSLDVCMKSLSHARLKLTILWVG